jgi:transcription elongation factor Elf1
MCAKSFKLVQAMKAAGYQVDPSVKSYYICNKCNHKTVISFIKVNLKNKKGPKKYVACFTCKIQASIS